MDAHDEAVRFKELGQDQYHAGELDEALETFELARRNFAQSGDRNGEGEMLNNLGVVCLQLDQHDQAQAHLEQARAIFEETGYRSGLGQALGNLGMLYAARNKPEQAGELYRQSLEIFEELGEKENAKAIEKQLRKLAGERLSDKLARPLLRLLGRLTGGDEEEEEEAEA